MSIHAVDVSKPGPGRIDSAWATRLLLLAFALALIVATAIRYALVSIETEDLLAFKRWYDIIADNGPFAGLRIGWFDYNVPHIYLWAALGAAMPWLDPTIAIKVPYIAFDYALAFAVYKCVGVKSNSRVVPLLAALATLMAPTVLANSSMWGQCDATYTTFLVACLYFLLVGRQAWAFVAFGLALCFKLQAMWLAPLFLWLLMKRACDWRCFLLVPAVFLAALIPAWLAGRPLWDLLTIYWRQANKPFGLHSVLPNLYAWLPEHLDQWWPLGVVFAACVVLLVAVAVRRSRVKMTNELVVFLAAYSVLLVPYVLPKMLERYFFPADVIGIVLAFYLPRYWFVPVIVGGVSFTTYLDHLLWFDFVAMELRALALLGVLAILTWQLLAMLTASQVLSVRQLLVSLAALSLVVGLMCLTGGGKSNTHASDDLHLHTPVEVGRTLREKLIHYRGYATAAIQTALPRVWHLGTGTLRPNARYQAAYRRIVADEVGEPLVQAVFDVYRDSKTLVYVKRPCSMDDIQAPFILQVTPLDRGRVRQWVFPFLQRGVIEGDLCVAIVPLPHFEIEHMRTGQYRLSNGRTCDGVSYGHCILSSLLWTGERMMSIWERPGTFQANPRHQSTYERAVAGDFGEPLARSSFDVYRDGKMLIYVKRPCSMDDIRVPIFLQTSHGTATVSSRSFNFTNHGVMDGDICIATVQMSDAIEHMHTGQLHPIDHSCIWCVEALWAVNHQSDKVSFR